MIDLHVHTCYSDGEHTPKEIVQMAENKGIHAIAITDHDSVKGINEAINEGKKRGVLIVPGIEITAFEGVEVHILGYNIDFNSDKISNYTRLREIQRANEVKNKLKYLNDRGIEISEHDVVKYKDGAFVTKWHFAMALVEKGYANNIPQALEFFLDNIYVNSYKKKVSVGEAIKLIVDTGGIPVLAHPSRLPFDIDTLTYRIKNWKLTGLKGIEAIYSLNSQEENEKFINLAKNMELKITIGSDYHGEHVKPFIKLGTGIDNNLLNYRDISLKVIKSLNV